MFLALKNKLINKSEIMTMELDLFDTTIRFLTKDLDIINIVYDSAEEIKNDIKLILEECTMKQDIDLFEIINTGYINLRNISSIQIYNDKLDGTPMTVIEVFWKGNKNLPKSFIREEMTQDEINKLIKTMAERGLK